MEKRQGGFLVCYLDNVTLIQDIFLTQFWFFFFHFFLAEPTAGDAGQREKNGSFIRDNLWDASRTFQPAPAVLKGACGLHPAALNSVHSFTMHRTCISLGILYWSKNFCISTKEKIFGLSGRAVSKPGRELFVLFKILFPFLPKVFIWMLVFSGN